MKRTTLALVKRCLASSGRRCGHSETSKNVPIELIPPKRLRNFSIVAHVDHGKSTLADRLIETCGFGLKSTPTAGLPPQVLDGLPVERERGITVKAQTASLVYRRRPSDDGQVYLLNLIDTPGHVDFHFEVQRSLRACQGCILLIDAVQGIQAQTMANFLAAIELELVVIPVLNKVDLPGARVEEVKDQMLNELELDPTEAIECSAKTGKGVEDILEAVVDRIPAPSADVDAPLRALLFDSKYDQRNGVVLSVAIKSGCLRPGDNIAAFHSSTKTFVVQEVGLMQLGLRKLNQLLAGSVGYLTAHIKSVSDVSVGDTIYHVGQDVQPLPGFRSSKPMVFGGFYPEQRADLDAFRTAVERLALNDPSVVVNSDANPLLGAGFRLGFLGVLHMDVFKSLIEETREPFIRATITFPYEINGAVTNLCMEHRGVIEDQQMLDGKRTRTVWTLPLAEIVTDFHDTLKSISSGYATLDYEDIGFRKSDLVKLTVLLNGMAVEEFSSMVHATMARDRARRLAQRLKELIPRQLYHVAIQIVVGHQSGSKAVTGKILARENIRAVGKNVVAKLYGGDQTRKMKLLKRQREGKQRMKERGEVAVPTEAFLAIARSGVGLSSSAAGKKK